MIFLKFIYKLEQKFGKYAIRNLPLYIVIVSALSYVFELFVPEFYAKLVFSPYFIFAEHEYWRIFTWIFTTPQGFNILTLVMLAMYYYFGSAVEAGIGTFMFNLYVFGGMLITTVSVTVTSAICYFMADDMESYMNLAYGEVAGYYLTYFMYVSIFLCYALVYSESVLLLNFLFPVKAKWLGLVDIVWLVYYFVKLDNIICRVAIVASVLNCVFLYVVTKRYSYRKKKTVAYLKRKTAAVKNSMSNDKKVVPIGITRHKCAICGRSEKDDPELEFRFCSKCKGNFEYCSEHLYTHEHVQ